MTSTKAEKKQLKQKKVIKKGRDVHTRYVYTHDSEEDKPKSEHPPSILKWKVCSGAYHRDPSGVLC